MPNKWWLKAACKDKPQHWWFAPKSTRLNVTASGICETCPVREECLDEALAIDGTRGCWAGTTFADREEMRERGVTAAQYFSR